MKKIMTIIHSRILSEYTRIILEAHGLTYLRAENAVKGMEKLQGEQYDVLIVEQQLPVITGTELIANVRKKQTAGDLQIFNGSIILLTPIAKPVSLGGADYCFLYPDESKQFENHIQSLA